MSSTMMMPTFTAPPLPDITQRRKPRDAGAATTGPEIGRPVVVQVVHVDHREQGHHVNYPRPLIAPD